LAKTHAFVLTGPPPPRRRLARPRHRPLEPHRRRPASAAV